LLMEIVFRLEEIHDAASQCLEKILARKVVAVYGAMGAGKTTFIHAVCDLLKVSSVVGSPTYSIINEYTYPGGKIFHMDLYRLRDEQEALEAGVEDSIYSGNICFVEWPERAPGIFPGNALKLFIEPLNEGSRSIRILDN
jgi:tRNA threonylcarbamoyladenosine biosynthesis protein TsaE